jgi:class 3 adenylate cyclase/tetratricopeptide (TPR) repeat protein
MSRTGSIASISRPSEPKAGGIFGEAAIDIASWLREIGLAEHAEIFRAEKIDAAVLPALSDADLRELGLPLGDRKKLRAAIEALGTAPEQPPAAAPRAAAEQRHLTVMFCDIVDSTRLAATLDLETLQAVIDAYQQQVASCVARYDGFVAKFMGDGVLVYFGYPQAHEDDAERAVRAGLDIVTSMPSVHAIDGLELACRIGIASGVVVIGDSISVGAAAELSVLGEAPNLAARLQAAAPRNGLVIAAGTRALVADLFDLKPIEPLALKGIGAGVPAWQVIAAHDDASRFRATRDPTSAAFIGRDAELALVLDRWAIAASGEGQLFLLSGEPGLGKSRLCEAMFSRITAEPHAEIRLQCSPYHGNSALYPVLRHLERTAGLAHDDPVSLRRARFVRLFPDASKAERAVTLLGPALGLLDAAPADAAPDGSKAETLDLLQDLLFAPAADQALCILVEDAHWIDPTTQELLNLLIDRIGDRRVLLLVTHRPEFTPPWGTPAHLTRLTINRLSARACAGLIADLARGKALPDEVLRQIVAKADGVPLVVEELTKAVLESGLLTEVADAWRLDGPLPPLAIPSSLHDSFMARLDRMAPVKEVAQMGAAIGREFSARLLAPVLDMQAATLDDALTRLVDAGLLVSRGGDIYAFKHALTRDAAYASLLKSRRQICHQRIATALEEFDDGFVRATEPELLAYHFQEAGDFSAALTHWIEAGDVAERRGASEEAVAHYRSAQRLTEDAQLPAAHRARAAEVLLKFGNAQWQTAGYQAEVVLQSYEAARDAALALDQQDEAAEANIRMANFLFGRCRHRDVLEIGRNISCGQPDRLRPETLVHLWVMIGSAHCHIGDFQQSRAFLERAIELDDQVNCTHKAPSGGADPAIVARDLAEMAARAMGHLDRSLAVSEQGMVIALERGHLFSIVWASVSRVLALTSFGCYAEAIACADHALSICEKHGFNSRIGNVLQHRGPALFELGDEERGLADIQRGVTLWRERSGIFFLARNLAKLGEYQLRANQLEPARASLDEAKQLAETTDEKMHLAEIIRLRGRLWQAEGRHEEAKMCFGRAIARARDQQARLFELNAARDLAKLEAEAGDPANALDQLRAIVDWFPPALDVPVLAECRALLR